MDFCSHIQRRYQKYQTDHRRLFLGYGLTSARSFCPVCNRCCRTCSLSSAHFWFCFAGQLDLKYSVLHAWQAERRITHFRYHRKIRHLWDRDIKVCYPVYGVFFLKTDTILPPGFDHFLVCHAASATSWDSSISGAEATSLIMPSSTLNAKFLCL